MQIRQGREEAWREWKRKNTTGYGAAILDYAERWAELMEKRMAGGAQLEDIASATGDEADIDFITGFMYGAAVSTLADVWAHGETLRRWHNGVYGVPDADGTVNPALLTIDVPEAE